MPPHIRPYTLIADSPQIEGTPYRPLYGGPYRLSMGEVLHGAGLLYPDLGLIFDDVSYAVPLYGERDDGPTTTSMTLYEFLLTSDYPQWVGKDIVVTLGTPIPIDLIEGADTGTWFMKVGHMLADGEYLYLEILGGGRGCNVVEAKGHGTDCGTLHPIPIAAICSICMPEGERWSKCPPLPPPLPPAPLPEIECNNNWGVVHE
jgi:hypothetical protein